jgi:hypothetical protein
MVSVGAWDVDDFEFSPVIGFGNEPAGVWIGSVFLPQINQWVVSLVRETLNDFRLGHGWDFGGNLVAYGFADDKWHGGITSVILNCIYSSPLVNSSFHRNFRIASRPTPMIVALPASSVSLRAFVRRIS